MFEPLIKDLPIFWVTGETKEFKMTSENEKCKCENCTCDPCECTENNQCECAKE